MKKIMIFLCGFALLDPLHFWVGNANAEVETSIKLPMIEQHQLSKDIFRELYKYAGARKRPANLEKMVGLYQSIIERCPDVGLAEESSLRLIELYFRDFQPPKKDKALEVYKLFLLNYPKSILHDMVTATVQRYLYINKFWKELLGLEVQVGTSAQLVGKHESPNALFLFAEAHYHLKDFENAEKGYSLIVKYFPKSRTAKRAQYRMDQITNISMKSN